MLEQDEKQCYSKFGARLIIVEYDALDTSSRPKSDIALTIGSLTKGKRDMTSKRAFTNESLIHREFLGIACTVLSTATTLAPR